MAHFALRFPDDPAWQHTDRAYSREVAQALIQAYAALRADSTSLAHFRAAFEHVIPLVEYVMCDQQRMRVDYVLASAFAAIGEPWHALAWIDAALDLATHQQDPDRGALIDLLYLRGATNRIVLRFREATGDYEDCLALLHEMRKEGASVASTLELELLSLLAGCEFFTAQYAAASHRLEEAEALTAAVWQSQLMKDASAPPHILHGSAVLIPATFAWLQAHLYRWQGRAEQALRPATQAAEAYTHYGGPASADRGHLMLAEIALDLAEHYPSGMERQAFLGLADAHLQQAMHLAQEATDEVGKALASLVQIRHSRLGGPSGDHLARIEQVARQAQRWDDLALAAQSLTALGDELSAQGRHEAARARYHEVIGLLEQSDVPALAVWAGRALHRDYERDQ